MVLAFNVMLKTQDTFALSPWGFWLVSSGPMSGLPGWKQLDSQVGVVMGRVADQTVWVETGRGQSGSLETDCQEGTERGACPRQSSSCRHPAPFPPNLLPQIPAPNSPPHQLLSPPVPLPKIPFPGSLPPGSPHLTPHLPSTTHLPVPPLPSPRSLTLHPSLPRSLTLNPLPSLHSPISSPISPP